MNTNIKIIVLVLGVFNVVSAAIGDLDTSFGTDGVVTTAIGSVDDTPLDIAIQSDGKIVVVGYSDTGSVYNVAIARYNTDGTLDADEFASPNGFTTTVIGSSDTADAVAIQSDGKIVVVGDANTEDFLLIRYNTDGSFDTDGFGINSYGWVTTSIGSGWIDDIAIQSDGKIVVVGRGGTSDAVVARYDTDGTLDTDDFGSPNGYTVTDIGSGSNLWRSMAIQSSDGKIVAGGNSMVSGDVRFTLARYNTDGTLDTTGFGSPNGYVTTTIGDNTERIFKIAIQSDGKIVAVGDSSGDDFVVLRYNTDGTLDTTGFGSPNGYVTVDIDGTDNPYALGIQSDGKIVVGGSDDNNFVLVRHHTNGDLDTTFGGDGKISTSINSVQSEANALTIQSDGKIVVTGWVGDDPWTFGVVRYIAASPGTASAFSTALTDKLARP